MRNGTPSLLILLFLFFPLNRIYAQTETENHGSDLYIAVNGGLGTSDLLVRGSSFGLFFDPYFRFSPALAVGSKTGLSFSSDNIKALESQLFLRWYFLSPHLRLGSYQNTIDLFLQGGIGVLGAFKGSGAQNTRSSVLFDITAGANMPLFSNWNIEPSLRVGYPFIIGFTITAGYRFPIAQKYRELPPNEIVRKISISSVEYIIFAANIAQFNEGVDANTKALNELIITQMAQTLKEYPEFLVRIEGHANPVTNDPKETEELYTLSINRANEIERVLMAGGIKKEQIVVIAHGGTRTITSSREEWSRNRRVELIVIQIDSNDTK